MNKLKQLVDLDIYKIFGAELNLMIPFHQFNKYPADANQLFLVSYNQRSVVFVNFFKNVDCHKATKAFLSKQFD